VAEFDDDLTGGLRHSAEPQCQNKHQQCAAEFHDGLSLRVATVGDGLVMQKIPTAVRGVNIRALRFERHPKSGKMQKIFFGTLASAQGCADVRR
jgi:hypothetical protein